MTSQSPAQESELPLEGLRVVELHAIGPVPFAGLQLLQMGAEVIRVCPPTHRGIGIDTDIQFDVLNFGKQTRAINLKESSGRNEFFTLLENADVLMEGFRPGVMERLDLDPHQLTRQFPNLIVARLSGFGRHGDYAQRAGHDINYLALSGVLAAIGTEEKPTVPLNLIADFGGGAMHLLTGILARLVKRGICGYGGIVDTSILAGTIGLTSMNHGLLAAGQWLLDREKNLLDGGLPFYRIYKTADNKFVAVGALEKPFFINLLQVLELSSTLSADDQYNSSTWDNMAKAFGSKIRERSRDEWAIAAVKYDCCMTPVLDFHESVNHPHTIANGWFESEPFPHPNLVTYFPSPAS